MLAHQLRQDAFAQPAVGNAQARVRPGPADRLEDGAAGENQIGAIAADAGIGGTRGIIHLQQPCDYLVDVAVVQPQAIDAAPVIARQIQMHAGNRRHRAGCAEQMGTTVLPKLGQRLPAVEPCQQIEHFGNHRLENRRIDDAAAVTLGEIDDADRQRRPGGDLAGNGAAVVPAPVDQGDLGRAAANIEQHGAVGIAVDQRAAALGGKIGFSAPVDDFEIEPGFVAAPAP